MHNAPYLMPEYINGALTSLEGSRMATAIAQSLYLLAGLSAVHVVGFTLLMGSALVADLRLLGVLLTTLPVADVTTPTRRAIGIGLAISVSTGVLMFSTRATMAVENGIFETKMLLLVVAAVFHFAVQPRIGLRDSATPRARQLAGAVGLLLWASVALAGCAFIFLE